MRYAYGFATHCTPSHGKKFNWAQEHILHLPRNDENSTNKQPKHMGVNADEECESRTSTSLRNPRLLSTAILNPEQCLQLAKSAT